MTGMIKRQLLVAHEYPPLAGPESIQSSRLVGKMPIYGWNSVVLTVKPAACHAVDKSLPERPGDETVVVRAGTWESKFLKGLAYAVNKRLLYCPDPKIGWYPSAVKEGLRLIELYEPAVIHSWSTPYTSHLVALKLVERCGLPWVAHFSDPWIDNPYIDYGRQWHRALNERWERRVIERADRLVFTSEETVDLVMRKYPAHWRDKSCVLPHTYDPDQLAAQLETVEKEKEAIAAEVRIVHTGHFYGKRTPEDLFKALALYKEKCGKGRLKFLFAGRVPGPFDSMPRDLGIGDMIEYLGVLPYKETVKLMAGADVLLTIDAPTAEGSVFLPSKLVEYLGCVKPIIGITPPVGTTARLLNLYGHIAIANDDYSSMVAVFDRLSREGTGWINFDREAHRGYTPQTVAGKLAAIFNELIAGGGKR